jgi:uncharacterized low-complexity protein
LFKVHPDTTSIVSFVDVNEGEVDGDEVTARKIGEGVVSSDEVTAGKVGEGVVGGDEVTASKVGEGEVGGDEVKAGEGGGRCSWCLFINVSSGGLPLDILTLRPLITMAIVEPPVFYLS